MEPGTGGIMGGAPDPDERARELAARAIRAGDATGWFERLYAAAETGGEVVPWDQETPHRLLVEWAGQRRLGGGRAIVVGCGYGRDAEFVAGLGLATVAFDISASAVRGAIGRHSGSPVRYVTADLLALPAEWEHAFDLVVESLTLQAMPDPPRREAIGGLRRLVAPGGTLLVIARAREETDVPEQGPPWALTRAEIEAIAGPEGSGDRLEIAAIEDLREPDARRWRAEYRRPDGSAAV